MRDFDFKLPRTVGQLQLFLSWELDEWAFFFIPVIIFLPIKQLIIGVIIGFAGMFLYSKFKDVYGPGFLVHFFAYRGILSFKKFKTYYKFFGE